MNRNPMTINPLFSRFLTSAFCDAAEPWQLGFQDPATPTMQGIIDLHHDIFFFLILLGYSFFWMLVRALLELPVFPFTFLKNFVLEIEANFFLKFLRGAPLLRFCSFFFLVLLTFCKLCDITLAALIFATAHAAPPTEDNLPVLRSVPLVVGTQETVTLAQSILETLEPRVNEITEQSGLIIGNEQEHLRYIYLTSYEIVNQLTPLDNPNLLILKSIDLCLKLEPSCLDSSILKVVASHKGTS